MFVPVNSRPHTYFIPRYHGLLATKETGAVFSFSLYGSVPLGNPTTEGCGVLSSKPCPKDVALYVMTPPDGEEKSQFGDSILTLNKNDIIQASKKQNFLEWWW
jgi:hypothetical protein